MIEKRTRKTNKELDRWNNRTQFADRINRHRQTVWRWERDGKLPPPDGHDPFGNSLWRDSTIDGLLTRNERVT